MHSSTASLSASYPTSSIGFPESFSRTTPPDFDETASSSSRGSTPSSDMSPMTPASSSNNTTPESECGPSSYTSLHRPSRSSVMRLENILNDVTLDCVFSERARSLDRSPVHRHRDLFENPSPASSVTGRSHSPEETAVKKKKVKMHKCPECQKEFPRPSGLRTHMNMHTKEKPYACAYPGCTRAFSVVSNAKRHMRTHGLGVTADDTEHPSAPYVVGFEEPVVIAQPEVETSAVSGRSQPFRLRWISLGSDSRLSNTNKVSVSPS